MILRLGSIIPLICPHVQLEQLKIQASFCCHPNGVPSPGSPGICMALTQELCGFCICGLLCQGLLKLNYGMCTVFPSKEHDTKSDVRVGRIRGFQEYFSQLGFCSRVVSHFRKGECQGIANVGTSGLQRQCT